MILQNCCKVRANGERSSVARATPRCGLRRRSANRRRDLGISAAEKRVRLAAAMNDAKHERVRVLCTVLMSTKRSAISMIAWALSFRAPPTRQAPLVRRPVPSGAPRFQSLRRARASCPGKTSMATITNRTILHDMRRNAFDLRQARVSTLPQHFERRAAKRATAAIRFSPVSKILNREIALSLSVHLCSLSPVFLARNEKELPETPMLQHKIVRVGNIFLKALRIVHTASNDHQTAIQVELIIRPFKASRTHDPPLPSGPVRCCQRWRDHIARLRSTSAPAAHTEPHPQ